MFFFKSLSEGEVAFIVFGAIILAIVAAIWESHRKKTNRQTFSSTKNNPQIEQKDSALNNEQPKNNRTKITIEDLHSLFNGFTSSSEVLEWLASNARKLGLTVELNKEYSVVAIGGDATEGFRLVLGFTGHSTRAFPMIMLDGSPSIHHYKLEIHAAEQDFIVKKSPEITIFSNALEGTPTYLATKQLVEAISGLESSHRCEVYAEEDRQKVGIINSASNKTIAQIMSKISTKFPSLIIYGEI